MSGALCVRVCYRVRAFYSVCARIVCVCTCV